MDMSGAVIQRVIIIVLVCGSVSARWESIATLDRCFCFPSFKLTALSPIHLNGKEPWAWRWCNPFLKRDIRSRTMIDVDSVINCVEHVPLRSKWLFEFWILHGACPHAVSGSCARTKDKGKTAMERNPEVNTLQRAVLFWQHAGLALLSSKANSSCTAFSVYCFWSFSPGTWTASKQDWT